MNKRKILMLVAMLCMVAILGIGGTLAYLTDTDQAENVFTVGNVKIEQKETDNNGQPFEQNQVIMPIINAGKKYEDPNYVWKNVTVKNTGKSAAYVRTFIAIPSLDANNDGNASNNWLHWNAYAADDKTPANSWYWGTQQNQVMWDYSTTGKDTNKFTTTIDGKEYVVFVATHTTPLAADPNGNGDGDETAPCLRGFYLDSSVDNEWVNGELNYFYYAGNKRIDLGDISNLKIYVATQACQAEGFEDMYDAKDAAWVALDKAFGPANTFKFQ